MILEKSLPNPFKALLIFRSYQKKLNMGWFLSSFPLSWLEKFIKKNFVNYGNRQSFGVHVKFICALWKYSKCILNLYEDIQWKWIIFKHFTLILLSWLIDKIYFTKIQSCKSLYIFKQYCYYSTWKVLSKSRKV